MCLVLFDSLSVFILLCVLCLTKWLLLYITVAGNVREIVLGVLGGVVVVSATIALIIYR